MLDVELSTGRQDILTERASDATNMLARKVRNSPYAPVMMAGNPHRIRLMRDIRSFLRKGETCMFVTLTTKSAKVTLEKPAHGALCQFEIRFRGGLQDIIVEDAAAVYDG